MTTYWLIQTYQLHILSKFRYYYIAFFLRTSLFCVFCILHWNSSNDHCQNLFSFEKIKELEEKEDTRDMERERQAWLQMAEKEVGDDDKSMHFMILWCSNYIIGRVPTQLCVISDDYPYNVSHIVVLLSSEVNPKFRTRLSQTSELLANETQLEILTL